MDYERESDTRFGEQPEPSETPAADADALSPSTDESSTGADDSAASGVASPVTPPTDIESPAYDDLLPGGVDTMPDLGTDADVMNDTFETREIAPPEWPAVDLARAGVGADSQTDDAAIASTYAAAMDEPDDLGDDSDAPILEDATAPVAATTDAAAATADAADQQPAADHVTISQSSAQTIQASTVTVSQGGAGRVTADTVSVEQGGLGLARTKTLTLGNGASAFAVVADEATVEEGSNAFLVVSRSFNGDVQPTIDWRVAAAFGAGLGLVVSILRRIR